MSGGNRIYENDDMDNFKEIGNYYCTLNSTAATLKNCPVTHAFTLKIEYGQGTEYISQTFIEYDTGRRARRYFTGETWQPYSYFSDDDTLMNTITAYAPEKPADSDDLSDIDIWTVVVRRFGRLVNIQFNVRGTIKTANKFIKLFALNEGYKPISSITQNYITQYGTPMVFSITTSGEVQLFATEIPASGDFIIRQTITFVASQL